VTEDKIRDYAVTEDKIRHQAVATEKIKDAAVTTEKLQDQAVSTEKIKDGAITTVKLQEQAITTDKIVDLAVTEDKIGSQAVTTDKIKDLTITEDKIKDFAVTEDKIKDFSITEDKIVDRAITGEKLADGSIGLEKLNFQPLLAGQQPVQTSGLAAFQLPAHADHMFVTVSVAQPMGAYIVVAMTNHPGCFASLHHCDEQEFTIRIQRMREEPQAISGTFFWIASQLDQAMSPLQFPIKSAEEAEVEQLKQEAEVNIVLPIEKETTTEADIQQETEHPAAPTPLAEADISTEEKTSADEEAEETLAAAEVLTEAKPSAEAEILTETLSEEENLAKEDNVTDMDASAEPLACSAAHANHESIDYVEVKSTEEFVHGDETQEPADVD
jgi:hypothetical protein